MITVLSRGRAPMILASSAAVLILWSYIFLTEAIMRRPPSGALAEVVEPGLGGDGDRFWVPQRCILPIVDLLQHALHPFLEAHLGSPAQHACYLGDVGVGALGLAGAPRHIDL